MSFCRMAPCARLPVSLTGPPLSVPASVIGGPDLQPGRAPALARSVMRSAGLPVLLVGSPINYSDCLIGTPVNYADCLIGSPVNYADCLIGSPITWRHTAGAAAQREALRARRLPAPAGAARRPAPASPVAWSALRSVSPVASTAARQMLPVAWSGHSAHAAAPATSVMRSAGCRYF